MTATYEVEFKDGDQLAQVLAKHPEISRDELQKAMIGAVRVTTQAVQKYTPLYTTRLRRSIVGTVEMRGITRQQGGSITGIVGTPLVYAPAVEFGLSAGHLPPEEPLIRWAAVKLGNGEAGKAVRWSIFHHGTQGQYMFKKGFEEVRGWVMRRFEQALDAIAKRLAQGGR